MHNTSTTYAGPMAFCTTTWDFEEANSDPNARQLTKFGLDYLQTEAMGHQYGFAASTLGPSRGFERWVKTPEEEALIGRHWMGVHMLLDMNPYLSSAPAVLQGLKTLGEFGWNEPDCRWIPFWEAKEAGLFTLPPEGRHYASLYVRGKKGLLVVLNDTNEDAKISFHPGPNLSLAGPLADAENPNARIPSAGGNFEIPVPRYNYRALLLETR